MYFFNRNSRILLLSFVFAAAAASCPAENVLTVSVTNPGDTARENAMVELPADSVRRSLGDGPYVVTDRSGREVTSQVTADGLLLFMTSLTAGASADYTVSRCDSVRRYGQLTSGRIYPERADDVAWENEVVAFRAYGPATQRKGERGYGYDIFFKHPTCEQVLERLYEAETNPANWAKADSLRRVSESLADEFVRTISYHVDNGLGMDCYAVGPTLGAGVAAPVTDGHLSYPWCYETARVIDNGPLRFTVELTFAPRAIAADTAVTEHRLISLDAGSYLNRTRVWYEGVSGQMTVAFGFPLRDDSRPYATPTTLAYSDPTQGPDNGRALLGAVAVCPFDTTTVSEGHILGLQTLAPGRQLDYYWGFAWSREPIEEKPASQAVWNDYLKRRSDEIAAPLIVRID